ncbi:MAG: hypothetical protein WC443_10570, partial [Desulfobaccales bacterium]
MIAYRTAKNLPGSEAFRQDAVKYLKSVIDVEWPQMQLGSMSPEASRHFDRLWSDLYALKGDTDMISQIYSSLTEAGRQRLARSILLEGNLYPPIWVILIFGLVSVVFGLYYINRQQTVVSLIFEFMAIFLLLSCLYFIYDLDMGWARMKGKKKHQLRFYLGLACFGLSLILPLFGILVAWLPLSLAAKATIIALLTVGGPELLGILAVICLGKENL